MVVIILYFSLFISSTELVFIFLDLTKFKISVSDIVFN